MQKVIVVGAGIAGLTASVYAAKCGFDVTLYESHAIPGGAATGWMRNGYHFEGGIHWLTGSSSRIPMNKVWREIGALNDQVLIIQEEIFKTFEYGGMTVHLYRDVDKTMKHWLKVAPEDRREIWRLCKDIRRFSNMSLPVTDLKGLKFKEKPKKNKVNKAEMVPAIMRMPFYSKQSCDKFSKRFNNPALRNLIAGITCPEYSAVSLVFTLATLNSGDGGYPDGGSLPMTRRMAVYFESLGGRICYNSPVEQVTVKNGRAAGVMVHGEEIEADAVIVTQDTYKAIDDLFKKPILESWSMRMRNKSKPLLCTFICLGIEADLSDQSHMLGFRPRNPLYCAGKDVKILNINNYAGYEGFAPEGCTAVTSIIMGDTYDWWMACKVQGTYEEEKEKLAKDFIRKLEQHLPQIAGKVAFWDVATPLTYERYIDSYKGSWMTMVNPGEKMEKYPHKSEDIENLYFAGQRLQPPGGLPIAAATGRTVVQQLCLDYDVAFVN